MDYPLENLGPDRFQQMCQALLVREHPDLQCFPVAQPDGGRDAISYILDHTPGKFIVFQVKFVRRPHAEADPHKWLLAILQQEAPKVEALIPKGASQYYLITNITGTAHLDAGSIDRLNETLTTALRIPSMCWWRDDLNRRLDTAWALKWVYPEIMTGPDFLRAIIESGLSQDRERRSAALRAFLSYQYKTDEQVRFKQIELQNRLLDLFIDVPVAFREQSSPSRQALLFHALTAQLTATGSEPDEAELTTRGPQYEAGPRWHAPSEEFVGAATLLLDRHLQMRMPHVVLEGAPGQGKSTIAQYVCQIHRMRLLGELEALSAVPPHHKEERATRLPIRVDLRDFATWLAKQNPFAADDTNAPPAGWHKSLEAFLAALISSQSGGTQFTTDDLIAVAQVSSILLVFDGLDEVADIQRRREVVDELMRGVQRLEVNAAALQTVITSRPAAFANSPGMPPDKYPYLQLLSLTRPLIDEYADRWLRARRLDSKEAVEFKKVLRLKLDLPHLRDLARNPMQLAILLSLILTRGASLPDKRTALYDNYIDLFFNRESEKSPVVREHRDLLIDIHRYLAWLLHSEAERGSARGSITQDRLQQTVGTYLAREGHDTRLARELFTGMVERVVALVSRVEGTFEFEVQTLREYFAARFLYDTAPYSPPGRERRGTKPERFDAVARNFYWTNVARFYAGCFSKGELPALVERLEEVTKEEGFETTTHPRMLAATLLSDWVFTQNPKSVQRVVNLVLDGIGLRYLLAAGPRLRRRRTPGPWQPFVLPPKCGRDELIQRCFEILHSAPPRDYALDVIGLLNAHVASSNEVEELWATWLDRQESASRSRWLEYGLHLGVLSRIELAKIQRLVRGAEPNRVILNLLYRARRLDYLEASEEVFETAVGGILDGALVSQAQRRIESPLDALSHAVNASRYAFAFMQRGPVSLARLISERGRPFRLTLEPAVATATESYAGHRKCVELARIAEEEAEKTAADWATEIGPWDRVVETGRGLWGDKLAFFHMANVAAGIRSTTERCKESDQLLDSSQPLCRRARHARLRSGAKTWWTDQLDSVRSCEDRLLVLLVALTWATPETLVRLQDRLDDNLRALEEESWHWMIYAARRAMSTAHLRKDETAAPIDVSQLGNHLSLRTITALALRTTPDASSKLYIRYFAGELENDPVILEFAQSGALDPNRFGTADWSPDLDRVQRCYELGVVFEPYFFRPFHQKGQEDTMPLAIATRIAREATKFPSYLVSLAEARCRREVAQKIIPVAEMADREEWFDAPRNHYLF